MLRYDNLASGGQNPARPSAERIGTVYGIPLALAVCSEFCAPGEGDYLRVVRSRLCKLISENLDVYYFVTVCSRTIVVGLK